MPSDDGRSPAPIDREILEYICERLRTTGQVTEATIADVEGHRGLQVTLSDSYYPDSVESATLFVRWYQNDDFKIHYRESRDGTDWECRWDRHPNPHNSRDHFHPPPDAPTPGQDVDLPTDYRETVRIVLDTIESRVQDIWSPRD